MKNHHKHYGVCHITKKYLPVHLLVSGASIRKSIFNLIKADFPDFEESHFVSVAQLNVYRKKYLEQLMLHEVGEMSELEEEVVKSINQQELLSSNVEEELTENVSFGDKVADGIAKFGGSWPFILVFFSFLFSWMAINVYILVKNPFDPFPFILLNLILSCLAAIQAPVIMMSQNRKELKDRQRSEHDYMVNLKAELEIRLLNEKIDHMILFQNQRLLEIQQLQIDLLEDILTRIRK